MARQFHHPHPSCAEWLSQSEVSFKCSPIRTSPHRRFSVFGYIISNMGLDLCSHNEPRRKRTCQTCKCVSTFPPVKHKHYLSPALPGEWGLFGCTRNTIPSPPPPGWTRSRLTIWNQLVNSPTNSFYNSNSIKHLTFC